MAWTSRNLGLLYINDEPELREEIFEFITVDMIRNFSAIADLMLSSRFIDRHRAIDMVFCDVNMERDAEAHSDDIRWNVVNPKRIPILAYGPLLAVPFLSSVPWCQFVPFSAFWTNPEVKSNGYTLLSLALILTMVDGEKRSTEDARREIERWAGEATEVNSWKSIHGALQRLRKKITDACNRDALTLNGIDTTINQLKTWNVMAKNANFRDQNVPFDIDGEPICVEISYDHHSSHTHVVDRINVSSLFADMLQFRRPTSQEPIDAIIGALDDWKKLKRVIPWQSKDPYNIARRLLFEYMPDSDRTDYEQRRSAFLTMSLKEKVEKVYGVGEKNKQFYWIVRLAILFAFTRAWYLVKHYDGYDVKKLAFHFLGVDRPAKGGAQRLNAITPFKRLLGVTRNNNTFVGTGHRRPFKHPDQCLRTRGSGEIDSYSAYCLDDDSQPASLTAFEQALCARFVMEGHVYPHDEQEEDRTDWRKEHFPRWMTEQYVSNSN
jgi:hypothetical protein